MAVDLLERCDVASRPRHHHGAFDRRHDERREFLGAFGGDSVVGQSAGDLSGPAGEGGAGAVERGGFGRARFSRLDRDRDNRAAGPEVTGGQLFPEPAIMASSNATALSALSIRAAT